MADENVFYQFSRSKVERCDFSHFLSLYGPDKVPSGRRLREMMNGMIFGIEGYDDEPREVHSVPEIRSFYRAFHEAWPYWTYFCNLDTETLHMMVLCCLPSIAALKVDDSPNVAVEYKPLDMLRFISNDFEPMNVMCERAELPERLIYDWSKAVFEYFNMPFDAQPPPE